MELNWSAYKENETNFRLRNKKLHKRFSFNEKCINDLKFLFLCSQSKEKLFHKKKVSFSLEAMENFNNGRKLAARNLIIVEKAKSFLRFAFFYSPAPETERDEDE